MESINQSINPVYIHRSPCRRRRHCHCPLPIVVSSVYRLQFCTVLYCTQRRMAGQSDNREVKISSESNDSKHDNATLVDYCNILYSIDEKTLKTDIDFYCFDFHHAPPPSTDAPSSMLWPCCCRIVLFISREFGGCRWTHSTPGVHPSWRRCCCHYIRTIDIIVVVVVVVAAATTI